MSPPIVRARARQAFPVLLAVACLACAQEDYGGPPQPTSWTEGDGFRWRPLAVPDGGRAGFTPIPASWSGVSFRNRLADSSLTQNQMLTNGSGVAAGDVDGDGRVDLYFTRLDGANALYRNVGDWRFEDVTEASGLGAADRYSTGAVMADVDGDGDLDLLLASIGGGKALYLNDGGGRFQPSPAAGLVGATGAMSLALADVDGDADLDLYVTNYKRRSVLDLFPPQERDFQSTVRRTERGFEVTEAFAAHYELRWRGNEVRRLERAEPDELYLNDGRGRFTPVAFDRAFRTEEGRPLDEAPTDWGLAARFGDLDRDGDPDLFVANDLHSPDRLWLNEGDGTFRAASPWALRTTSASSMAVDFSDVDRDGDWDIFTLDMLSRSSRLRKTQDPVARVERALPGEIRSTQQVARNALLLARGDGTFAEAAQMAGVEASDWSWSALFIDVDLDGFEDLVVANGHIRDLMDADTQIRLRNTRLEDWRQSLALYAPLPLDNVAFRNVGDGRFEEVGRVWRVSSGRPDISHGAALADLDGDGDLDVVMNRLDDPALLLRNDAPAPRLAVRLSGRAPNTAGIGATIRVLAPGLPPQLDEITGGGGYLSGSESMAAFALGAATTATIEVRWPGGVRSSVAVDGPDRLYMIDEPPAEARAGPDVGAGRGGPGAALALPWFALDTAFAPLHEEPPFDDFARQPLLPLRLSQPGPAVAWHDLDGDGDPDLVFGSGAGAAPALFRNDAGELRRVALPGPYLPVDQTAVLPMPSGAGGGRLVVGLSSYEAPDPGAVPGAMLLEWAPGALAGRAAGAALRSAVPGRPDATGALAAADYDGDGWLDLFVAGRVRPGRYPEAAASRLFRGLPGGTFEPDPSSDGLLRDLGMVSGVAFSDVDVDGDPDLVLATEWGPVRVLRNRQGRFEDATADWGLDGVTSRWNAVATGDFDGDGRPDIVAASWGENTEYRATADRPLEAYFGDVDRNGTLDFIEGQYDPRIRGTAPMSAYGRLARAIPRVAERQPTHAAYADATLEEALGAQPEGYLRINSLAHTVFMNRGDRFEAHRLPDEAQRAPSLGLAVADADGDGAEDLFMAQNFFATDEDSPRYDAGRGLWLRGDGRGGFFPVPAARSGVAAYGDQRGVAVADVDGDGRIDLALGQNGAELQLYLNIGGAPGLRVRLVGPTGNPYGIGASLRVLYREGPPGPAREVRAGSGAGSHDDPLQVLGLSGEPRALEVRWPGGQVQVVPVDPAVRELSVRWPGPGEAAAGPPGA